MFYYSFIQMKNYIFPFLLMLTLSVSAQKSTKRLIKTINKAELSDDLEVLTSDSLEGRSTGEIGAERAARYIETRFRQMGLQPFAGDSYRQEFPLWRSYWEPTQLVVDGKEVNDDWITYMGLNPVNEVVSREVVYVGNGNDTILAQLDLNNKIALVKMDNLKRSFQITSRIEKTGAWAVWGFNPKDETEYDKVKSRWELMSGVMNTSVRKPVAQTDAKRFYIVNDSAIVAVTGEKGLQLAGLTNDEVIGKGRIAEVSLKSSMVTKTIPAWNIVGLIKGSDPDKKAVALTAHYDHVGRFSTGEICRGADDNASGVASILSVAESLTELKQQPKQDVVVIAFSAEELGLYGSSFYMDNSDPKRFMANVNVDMIGRHDTLGHDNYVYILGADETP